MTKTFDIVGKRKRFYIFSSALILITIIASLIFGVDLDIMFKGGTLIKYSYTGEIDIKDIQKTTKELTGLEVNVSLGESITNAENNINLSFASNEGLTADKQFELTNKLTEKYADNNLSVLSSTDISPTAGSRFFLKCLVAVGFSSLVLIIYIGFRFKRISGWSAGVMAVIALFHDVIIVFATFVFFRFNIDKNFMAVVLTILGYSINDTIVIYDRIRENKKLYAGKMEIEELVNLSINQSLSRSINTSISTVLALVCVCVVSIASGVTSILSFAFPLIIGMISGVYSTICIAGPLWVDWIKHKNKKNEK